MVNEFKLTVIHVAHPNLMQICACVWSLSTGQKTVENQDWAAGCWAIEGLLSRCFVDVDHVHIEVHTFLFTSLFDIDVINGIVNFNTVWVLHIWINWMGGFGVWTSTIHQSLLLSFYKLSRACFYVLCSKVTFICWGLFWTFSPLCFESVSKDVYNGNIQEKISTQHA